MIKYTPLEQNIANGTNAMIKKDFVRTSDGLLVGNVYQVRK